MVRGGGVGEGFGTPPHSWERRGYPGPSVWGPRWAGPGRAGVERESGLQQPQCQLRDSLRPGLSTTPLDGVARQRGSDVREGLLICQPPADTWLRLLPAYPEEGRGARCLHTAEPRVHLNARCKRQPEEGARGALPPSYQLGPTAPPPILSTPAGSSPPVPARFLPSSPNHGKAKCSREKRSVGKRVCAGLWRCQGAWA